MLGRVQKKMLLRKVAILLTLFIFAMIDRAWCDPVKSVNKAAIQLTTMKMDENKAVMQEKTDLAKKSTEWSKKSQANSSDINLLRTPEEKKRPQWVESQDKLIYSREVLENAWRNRFFSSQQIKEPKSSAQGSEKSILKPNQGGNGYFEEGRILTTLRLLQSKEETFKEIFMGFRFSVDLTYGHVLLEMNVTPSSEKRSGFIIRF
jgi:hypothetical protein